MRPKAITIDETIWGQTSYDLSIFALGFESRATSLLESLRGKSNHLLAFGFDHGHSGAYLSNLQKFTDAGATVIAELSDVDFETTLANILKERPEDSSQTFSVDISCFSRFRLAAIVHALFEMSEGRKQPLIIDFIYSVAEFEPPTPNHFPNTVVGPAHPAFAGWSQGGYSSTAAVVGLGYEQDQALGVVEYLQAGEVWTFIPDSPIPEYKPKVMEANNLLLCETPKQHVIEYDVCSPASIVTTLDSVVRGLSGDHSVVLVPFGPKIFVLSSLLVAAMRDDVAVWRVSQGSHIPETDRRASGVRVGLRLSFPGQAVL
ncbi:hypothetical protein [Rubrivivax gelatinosus]|uniref:hypothetical protein n=1 Tax=Rubrivivax gelatinosus TaxID=28068 RepID=UPI0012FD036A|nr:hypothetical protein [Rubrivivax gelatinosus]MBG6080930.1 hypothetical protein [Rubrivivax gelatinosus]